MLSVAKELVAYTRARKKWWLLPIMAILMSVGALLVLAQDLATANRKCLLPRGRRV
jgi:Family of unknown function (DUF5989)